MTKNRCVEESKHCILCSRKSMNSIVTTANVNEAVKTVVWTIELQRSRCATNQSTDRQTFKLNGLLEKLDFKMKKLRLRAIDQFM